jgi:hypothetical protein
MIKQKKGSLDVQEHFRVAAATTTSAFFKVFPETPTNQ